MTTKRRAILKCRIYVSLPLRASFGFSPNSQMDVKAGGIIDKSRIIEHKKKKGVYIKNVYQKELDFRTLNKNMTSYTRRL